eukprot:11066842-Lingulodinium_polyedra.AAC.1
MAAPAGSGGAVAGVVAMAAPVDPAVRNHLDRAFGCIYLVPGDGRAVVGQGSGEGRARVVRGFGRESGE